MAAMHTKTESVSNGYRYYILVILALTYAFSFMDRQIVSILLGDIKAEFQLNDAQLGLLSGLAFAIFYTTMAIPIARYADKHNRINIISTAVALWSLVTAACAYTGNFFQLLLCRIGVGVGEAGGLSPAHSVISDYFKPQERALAISIFSLGAALGSFMGLAMGGYVAENYGWRTAFLVAGLPGILLALAVKLTIREPLRGAMDDQGAHPEAENVRETFKETVLQLVKNNVYVMTVVAHMFAQTMAYAIAIWLPQYMLRSFDVSQSKVGTVVGLVSIFGVAGGMLAGGVLVNCLASLRSRRWELRVPAVGMFISIPVYIAALTADAFYLAAILFAIGNFFLFLQLGPAQAVVQNCVPQHQRATAASLTFFFGNLLGLGLGPLVMGAISDIAEPSFGQGSLSVALACFLLFNLLSAFFYYRTSLLVEE